MPVRTMLGRIIRGHRRNLAVVGLLAMASLVLLIAGVLQQNVVDKQRIQADQLRHGIDSGKADLAFFNDSRQRETEIRELLATKSATSSEALASIPGYAQALGIGSVTYRLGKSQRLWENEARAIEQSKLQLQLKASHEWQIFDFLNMLEANWGGRFFFEQIEFSHAEENGMLITAEVAFQWRKPLSL